jgi:hypothetical protein
VIRQLLQRTLLRRRDLAAIQLLVCDVDGVLTDGGLHYDAQGQVLKRFDVRDGLAIRMLQRAGIEVAFLSGGPPTWTSAIAWWAWATSSAPYANSRPISSAPASKPPSSATTSTTSRCDLPPAY